MKTQDIMMENIMMKLFYFILLFGSISSIILLIFKIIKIEKYEKNNINNIEINRTKLANQRTFLAYIRTGFAIAGIAGTFKKYWIALFGIIMIIISSLQYFLINQQLNEKTYNNNKIFDFIPILYVLLSLGALYLQFYKK